MLVLLVLASYASTMCGGTVRAVVNALSFFLLCVYVYVY